MKSNTALVSFLEGQQSLVSKILGVQFISLWQFCEETGVLEENALRMIRRGRIPGAQKVQFKDRCRWIVPATHNIRITKGRPRLAMCTKKAFETILNQQECPPELIPKSGIGAALVPKNYGTWLRRRHLNKFNALYDEHIRSLNPVLVAPKKKPQKVSNEKLFPL